MQKIITIDGGAATGKSFISEEVARYLNYKFIATGKLYRLLAIYFHLNNLEITNDLNPILQKIKVTFVDELFTINDFDYDQKQLFDQRFLKNLSLLSANPQIRNFCNFVFNQIVETDSHQTFIIEGRDAGTVIFPNANLKFFLEVDEETAAKRRLLQEQKNNPQITLKEVQTNLRERNQNDANREVGPLFPAENAIIIDTSVLSKEEILAKIINLITENNYG